MVRRRLLVGALAVGLMVAGIAASAIASSHPASARPHLSGPRILRIAETAATRAGDPNPTLIQHSAGTRRRANLIASGDQVPGRRWSYLIAERGHFVLKNPTQPLAARAPRGSVLTLVVDASTGKITDSGLSNRYPHLTALGPVHTDLRLVSVAWQLAGASGVRVTVRYTVPGCTYLFWPASALETPRTVTIGVYYRYTGPLPPGLACPAVAILGTATERLHSPLDHRRLLHAPVTPGLPPI